MHTTKVITCFLLVVLWLCAGCENDVVELENQASLVGTALNHRKYMIESIPRFYFYKTDRSPALIFCETGNSTTSEIYTVPTVLVQREKEWEIHKFPEFEGKSWVYVGSDYQRKKIWAIVDHCVEGPGWELILIMSQDQGMGWFELSTIPKVYYMAFFHSFRMAPDGKGQLVMKLDDDYGSSHQLGYYSYRTNDWGATWRGPLFTPDIVEDSCQNATNVDKLMKNLDKY